MEARPGCGAVDRVALGNRAIIRLVSEFIEYYEAIFSDPCLGSDRNDAAPASVPSWNFHWIPNSSAGTGVLRPGLLSSWLLLRALRIRLLSSAILEASVLGPSPLVVQLISAGLYCGLSTPRGSGGASPYRGRDALGRSLALPETRRARAEPRPTGDATR